MIHINIHIFHVEEFYVLNRIVYYTSDKPLKKTNGDIMTDLLW